MSETYSTLAGPLTPADVAAQIAASVPTTYVGNGAIMTLDALMTNFPAGAAYNGMYAHVSNLYNGVSTTSSGGVDEILRCRYDVTNAIYRWQPQRPDYNTAIAATGSSVTLTPLVTPPTVRLNGTLAGNVTISTASTFAYIGQKFRVIQNSVLGLFTTTLTGLLGSNLTLLGNTTTDIEFTANGWTKAST